MITFHSEIDFELPEADKYTEWIIRVCKGEGVSPGDINYVFLDDESLREINVQFLGHDYYTDIITFELGESDEVSADIYISIERVRDNAVEYGVTFEDELRRVMVHGLLHCLGWKDKEPEDQQDMRDKESMAIEMFHVKH